MRPVLLLLPAMLLAARLEAAAPFTPNYDEDRVPAYTLPDPLVFADGRPVKSARDWRRRREELLGAYTNLDAVLNVDYVNTDGLDSNSYRKGPNFTAGRNVNNDGPLTGDNSNNLRGDWSVTSNYKIGWVGTGEWMNYTRTFPAGDYNVYAGLSHGEQLANQLSASLATVAGDVTTTNQTATVVGTFSGTGTGGWGSNDLIPLMNGGSMATVSLSGTQTVRFNLGSGDYDFLLLYPAGGGGGGESLSYSVSGGQITVTAPAGYTLQKSTSVTGSAWNAVASPHTESIGSGTAYFRGVK